MGYLGNIPASAQISVGTADELSTPRDINLTGEATGTASFNGTADADITVTLDANVTDQGNTFNGNNQLVQLDGSGALPAVDGSNLTGISAGSSTAVGTTVDTTNFNGILSGADTNVKLALETVDDHNHSGVYEPADGTIVKDADIGVTVQGYDANTTTQGNTFNGVSQLVQLDGSGNLPAIDGSALTNLPSGTTTVDGATDTNFTALADGDIMVYDNATGKWINTQLTVDGGAF